MTTIQRSFAALMLAAVASIAVADGDCPAFGVDEGVLQHQQQTDEEPGKLKQLVEELEEEEDEDEEPDCE